MPWTDLGDGIRVRQSVIWAMNSVALSHPEHTLIVDPGVLPSELDDLARATRGASEHTTLYFTHGDWDHVLGRPWWPGAPVIAHDKVAAQVKKDRDYTRSEAERAAAENGERWDRGFEAFRPEVEVSGLHYDKLGPWRVVFRDAPGHCDSMLTLHLPEHRLLIAGDQLSDLEIPILKQTPAHYRRTIEAFVPLAEHGAIETLIPGHGAVAHGAEEVLDRIERDLGYLDALERGVAEARARGLDAAAADPEIPAEYLPPGGLTPFLTQCHRRNIEIVFQTKA